jgi:hypothetical protein
MYICEGAGLAAILERGHSYLCGVEMRLGLERGVALVLELFAIVALIRLEVACNLTS